MSSCSHEPAWERDADTSNTVIVDFSTANGTAIVPNDYITASGSLTFNIGESSKIFSIGITDNNEIDGDKTINLSLSNAQTNSGDVVLDNQQSSAIVSIVDDETPTSSDDDDGGGGAFSLSALLLMSLWGLVGRRLHS